MTSKSKSASPATPPPSLRETIAAEAVVLDRELAEIDMLITQARQEAGRHEQKRTQAVERMASSPPTAAKELQDLNTQLLALTRRAALMEAQVDVLEGKRKTIARFRDALARHAESEVPDEVSGAGGSGGGGGGAGAGKGVGAGSAGASRTVLAAQEDLRREIARAMHDGPAQSLTNIVLQAQIVERLVAKDPAQATGEVRLLVSMVQQTLEATKSFIFDVRPMVLDDLGLVPTLRRAARERGRRAGIAIAFESVGADRRLPPEVESGLFRILDEALAAYLSTSPDELSLRLDWSDRVEATVAARRAGAALAGISGEPELPEGTDLPPALAAMLDDRRADRQARVEAAMTAAIAALPAAAWQEIEERAATLGATAELLDGGGTLRIVTAPDQVPDSDGASEAATGSDAAAAAGDPAGAGDPASAGEPAAAADSAGGRPAAGTPSEPEAG